MPHLERLRATLLTDGSSDRVLIPILRWLLVERLKVPIAVEIQWADLRNLGEPARSFEDRMTAALRLYPCELLFVHRDAERARWETRYREIDRALAAVELGSSHPIRVIPVRMQEAWLLLDEIAIRKSAGNPRGTAVLSLPAPRQLESLRDPKQHLHRQLVVASGLNGRRRKKFDPHRAAFRLAGLIRDFSPLVELPAVGEVEREVKTWLRDQTWPALNV